MADTASRAAAFAARWYARPNSGCDEATLASMLENEIVKLAREDERERIAAKLVKFVRTP